MSLADWLDYEIFGVTTTRWGVCLVILIALFALFMVLRRLIRSRLDALASHSQSLSLHVAQHVVGETKAWFLFLIALFAALHWTRIRTPLHDEWVHILAVGFFLQMGIWAVAGLSSYLTLRRERRLVEDPGAVAAMDIIGFLLRLGIWTMVLLLILDNFNINITALVAGLGIGGIAIALAAQNLLGDLFASLSIVLDRPFALGDFLMIDDMVGTVEKVGLKTTRIRSLSGEQLVVSNNDLLASRIRNFGRMFERRVQFSIGVTYQTPHEKLKAIPAIIEDIIVTQKSARFDRAHFKGFGDFSLNFDIVWFVETSDYRQYMDIQQAINLEICRRFEEAGIEFAYPTQTLFIEQGAADAR